MSDTEADYVDAGFKRVDHVSGRPPKINWGRLYKDFSDEKKIRYLENLASTMNHAADLLQKERDELNSLCILKEAQLTKMDEAVRQNNDMLQSEVTRMNADRQNYNAEIAKLRARVKELERGGDDRLVH